MKKFISFIPMQRPDNGLLYEKYKLHISQNKSNRRTHFPICNLIDNYLDENEQVKFVAIIEEGNEDCLENLNLLKKELDKIVSEKSASYSLSTLEISKDESVRSQLNTFIQLSDVICDDDEIYLCITFGTKPLPIVEMMCLNYVYKTKNNVSIKCVAYGKVNRKNNKIIDCHIYDITALFFMSEIANNVAASKINDPEQFIKTALRLGEIDE